MLSNRFDLGYEWRYGTIEPTSVGIIKGHKIELECISERLPDWTLNKKRTIKGAVFLKNKIFIKRAKQYHEGVYGCFGTELNGSSFNTIAVVRVGRKCIVNNNTLVYF